MWTDTQVDLERKSRSCGSVEVGIAGKLVQNP